MNWDSFCQAANDANAINWSPSKSKWSPADGRDIKNSLYCKYTGQNNLPDLRGVFLRGLNEFDLRSQQPVSSNQADPDNIRKSGSYQTDEFKIHTHTIKVKYPQGPNGADYSAWWSGDNSGFSNAPVQNAGGSETRPKNIAVYYYIKIN